MHSACANSSHKHLYAGCCRRGRTRFSLSRSLYLLQPIRFVRWQPGYRSEACRCVQERILGFMHSQACRLLWMVTTTHKSTQTRKVFKQRSAVSKLPHDCWTRLRAGPTITESPAVLMQLRACLMLHPQALVPGEQKHMKCMGGFDSWMHQA